MNPCSFCKFEFIFHLQKDFVHLLFKKQVGPLSIRKIWCCQLLKSSQFTKKYEEVFRLKIKWGHLAFERKLRSGCWLVCQVVGNCGIEPNSAQLELEHGLGLGTMVGRKKVRVTRPCIIIKEHNKLCTQLSGKQDKRDEKVKGKERVGRKDQWRRREKNSGWIR